MEYCYHLNLTKKQILDIDDEDDKGTLAKVKKKRYRNTNEVTYQVIRYDKDIMTRDEYKTIGLYRSVICDLKNNNIVIFSPPKSISEYSFKKQIDFKDVIVEEFVEGTMINLFWDKNVNDWEIATRSVIGAKNKFFNRELTFRDMFFDAKEKLNISFNELNKNFCYSLILQHPENRIVVPINECSIYLAEVYEIVEDGDDVKINIKTNEFRSLSIFKHPKVYDNFTSYDECLDHFCSGNTTYDILGVVFKSGPLRCKIRNPNYEEIRHLRGNDPKLQYIYLSLRNTGKLSMYLKLYAEHKKAFNGFRDQMHRYTKQLHNNYIDCFVKKEKKLSNMPNQYKSHLYCLHKIYLDSICNKNKIKITFSEVKKYFNHLHPSRQMFALNYNYRKSNKLSKN